MASFLEQSYLDSEGYLGETDQQMPPPDMKQMVMQPQLAAAPASQGLIQIPFTDIVMTKQTALLLAAGLAIGAWYFFVYKKK